MRWLIAAIPIALGLGCNHSPEAPRPILTSLETMRPDRISNPKAILKLGGTDYKVTLKESRKGNVQRIALSSEGQEFEHETYLVEPEAFRLRGTSEEEFVPAIDLLRFPMAVGDGWGWKGNLVSGSSARAATATVKTETLTSYTDAGGSSAVHVTVDLVFDSGSPSKPGERRLQFWFERGVGLTSREFGSASTRAPAP